MVITSPAPSAKPFKKTFMDLPHELLDEIFGYLDWEEILNSSIRICKKVHAVVEKDYFWQKRLNAAIQVPIDLQKLPQLKGVPTKRVFLAIGKARFYTWGESTLGKLGHSYPVTGSAVRSHRIPRGIGIPIEIRTLRNVFIVDIKTGGWSTHFLTFHGDVYSFGSMNGYSLASSKDPVRRKFPDPIVQISAGRNHLVALSSKGDIYSYIDLKNAPQRIRFLSYETVQSSPYSKSPRYGQVTKVVGGWNCSGALVHEVGIIIWRHEGKADPRQVSAKGMTIKQSDNWVEDSHVPPPGLVFSDDKIMHSLDSREPHDPLKEMAKQIVDFIILENYLVFITAAGKVYCVELINALPASQPILLENFSTPDPQEGEIIDKAEAEKKKIDRISGFFRRFAVYNQHGLVYVGNTEILKTAVEDSRRAASSDPSREELKPLAMPSLQRFGTIAQIAFGDYHSHALTHDGKLLSWGVESQNCGCLGIGDHEESERRGVVWENGNGRLDEVAEVFFHDPPYPRSAYPERTAEGVVDWDVELRKAFNSSLGDEDPDGVRLDTREFCVFNITAAGWHSGALVLPITDYLRTGTKLKEVQNVFPAIGSGTNNIDEEETFQLTHGSEHEREFNPSTLSTPRTGHRGIRGISTVARGMRGGLRGRGGGLSASGVVRSGADEGMRRRVLGGDIVGEEHEDEAQGAGRGDRGRGALRRGGARGLYSLRGRQLSEDTAEAGERLGESVRAAARERDRARSME